MAAPTLRYDLAIQQLPGTLPNVGGLYGKNTIITDPGFGTQIVRATDASSGQGSNFDSMQTKDTPSGHQFWNTDDTMFVARNSGGQSFLFQFNPATMQSTQLGTSGNYKFGGACCFSRASNGVLYQMANNGTAVIANTYALIGGVWTYQSQTTVCDFVNILPGGAGFNVTWTGELGVSAGDAMFGLAFSNAGNQGTGVYFCLFQPGAGYRMLNTSTLAVTGGWGTTGTATLNNYSGTQVLIHDGGAGTNPNYASFNGINPATGQAIIGSFIWANAGLSITLDGFSGHKAGGYLADYSGGPGGGQYVAIPLNNPTTRTYIIPVQAGPPGLPKDQSPPQTYVGDQHSGLTPTSTIDASLCWISNGPQVVNPFTSCWMQEVRGLDVTGAISGTQGIVYRLCHTFNSGKSTEFIVEYSFALPSQTGNFVAFSSDWGGAGTIGPLGSTSGAPQGTIGKDARGDVFIARVPFGAAAPVFTSANATTFTQGTLGSFSVNTTGSPTPALSESGTLPGGVTFVDNGNGTGTLSGTPTASGTFAITFIATNSAGTTDQPFTLTVQPEVVQVAPTITSANSATFKIGYTNSFVVNTTGTPTPAITETGALPTGVTFHDNGNGTATLAGTPTATGTYHLTIGAANGVLPNATQAFTLHVVAVTPPPPVSGQFVYPNGSPVSNGTYQFKLNTDAINNSAAMMVPTIISGSLDANGNLAASLVFNDQLQTALGATTNYQLTVNDSSGRQVWNETYYLTGTAANLNLIPPGTGVQNG